MAGRTLNRRELRRQADQAEQPDAGALDAAPAAAPTKKKAPKAPAPKRKPRAKKEPPRLRARWGVFDAAMKQVAVFDYSQRTAADAKLADLRAKKKGLHFLQIVKEPMPEPAPPEAPSPACDGSPVGG
jgi:hypothetical protein